MRTLSLAVIGFALLACGGDDSDDGEGESEVAKGCMHFEFGPHCSLPESAMDDEPCGAQVMPHQHFDLTDASGLTAEFVVPTHGEYILLIAGNVTLEVTDDTGAAVAPEETESPVPDCSAAAVAHHFELHPKTYTLTFGAAVEFVAHQVDGAHDHDHH